MDALQSGWTASLYSSHSREAADPGYGGLTPNAQPWDITALPDGTLWFTEENVDQVGMIDPAGFVFEYPTGQGGFPTFITTGPDGKLWFTEYNGNKIGVTRPHP